MYLSGPFCPSHVKSMAAFMCTVLVDRNKLLALSPCAAGHVLCRPASPSQSGKYCSADMRDTSPLCKTATLLVEIEFSCPISHIFMMSVG